MITGLVALAGDLSWMDRAACLGLPAELMFPERGDAGDAQQAKAVCRTCPVQPTCLQYAIDTDQDQGVWGGATRNELLVARRVQNQAAR